MKRRGSARQDGVALAVVVWFIAGMALLVAGTVSRVTVDTRLAQAHLFRAQAEAAGDGAISLLLADLHEGAFRDGDAPPAAAYRLGEHDIRVLALPTRELLDLNRAPLPQLRQLFQRHAGLDAEEARSLAASVIEWRRSGGRVPPRAMRFEVVEDLLRVEGMTRTRLDDVRHLVTAGARGSARPKLAWIAAQAPAQRVAAGTLAPRRGGPWRAASAYRVDALVEIGDQHWLRRRWVDMSSGAGSRLPWSTRRAEPARAIGAAP